MDGMDGWMTLNLDSDEEVTEKRMAIYTLVVGLPKAWFTVKPSRNPLLSIVSGWGVDPKLTFKCSLQLTSLPWWDFSGNLGHCHSPS